MFLVGVVWLWLDVLVGEMVVEKCVCIVGFLCEVG